MAKNDKITEKPAKKIGRPSKWNDELANNICRLISTSNKSLRTVCKEVEIDVAVVLKHLNEDERFLAQYTRAKEEQADYLAEEIIEIADDSSNDTKEGMYGPMEDKEWTSRSKLRVEARKWVASKLKPKKYGDKLELNQNANVNLNLSNVSDDKLNDFLKAAGFDADK